MDKSAPFRVRANFEPLCTPLQSAVRFLSIPIPSTPFPPLAGSIPCEKNKERIGLTKFRIANNVRALGATFEPGGFVSICLRTVKVPLATSAPFGVSVCRVHIYCNDTSLISLIPCNDSYDGSLYILHNTLILAVRPILGYQISHVVPRASYPSSHLRMSW